MNCRYCRHYNGGHQKSDPPCPELLTGQERESALSRWQAGWNAGREGQAPNGTDPYWDMGWIGGDAACDEAGNSVEWTTYP